VAPDDEEQAFARGEEYHRAARGRTAIKSHTGIRSYHDAALDSAKMRPIALLAGRRF
jgi:hypothetical protein